MTAELEARKTAAAALLADFQRRGDEYAAGVMPSPDWLTWALRLATDLGIVLDQLGRELQPCCDTHNVMICTDAIGCRDYLIERRGLASCGHPANDDGECDCAWWPERAPAEADHRDRALPDGATAAALTAAEAATAVAGLTDAAEWHEYRASLTCADCAASPEELCAEHAAALDAAGAYRTLAARLDTSAAAAADGLPVCACGHDLAAHRRRGASPCVAAGCRCASWRITARAARP